ncbi:hypothetical protein HDU67_003613 [Dinochytrium kinnereticum]|nr:hypothetical protein HDU67_003613 [Dinochytrium kinnereticum]
MRNNSAWNHRFFVYKNRSEVFSGETLASEILYVTSKILSAPHNESPWNYLRGLAKLQNQKISEIPAIDSICRRYADESNFSSFAAGLLLDILEERIRGGEEGLLEDYENRSNRSVTLLNLCAERRQS